MRLATHATAAMVASAASAHIMARDLPTVKTLISQVTDNVETLDKAVTSFNGTIDPVIKDSKTLISSLNNGTTTLDNTSDLSSDDAFSLLNPIYDLRTKGETLATDLKCQRPAIEKGHLCSQTRDQVSQINSASKKLVAAAIAKIPKGLQSISSDLSQTLTDSLQDVQDYFSESNCIDGGNGGNSSTASACSAAASTSSSPTISPSPSSSTTPKDGAAYQLAPLGYLSTAVLSLVTVYLSMA